MAGNTAGLSPEAEGYGWAWGAIRGAVSGRASTSEIFEAVRNEGERLGVELPPNMWAAVNELRSAAVAIRNAGELSGSFDPGSLLTRDMAPWDINARNLADANLFPEIKVTFDMTHETVGGEIQTITRTMRDTWTPGMTWGDVLESVRQSAEGLAQDYGISLVGVSNLTPTSI